MNSKNTDKMEELLKEQAEIKQKILDNVRHFLNF
jgi:hypothetical protein